MPEEDEPAPAGRGGMRPATLYASAFDVLYKMPALSGFGEHWCISKAEGKALGDAFDAMIRTLPGKSGKAIQRALKNYLPMATFVATASVITVPRVQQSIELIKLRKLYENTVSQNPQSPEGENRGNGTSDGLPAGSAYRHLTHESN